MLTVISHSVPKTFPWPRCVHAGEFLPRSTFAHTSSGTRSVRGWTSLSAPSSKLRFHWLLQALVQLRMLSLHSALLCCILGVVNDAPSILFGGQGDGSKTFLQPLNLCCGFKSAHFLCYITARLPLSIAQMIHLAMTSMDFVLPQLAFS